MAKSRKNIYQVETKEVVDLETGEVGTIETVKKQKISFDSEPFYMVFIDYVAPLYKLSNATSKNVLAWMCNKATFNTGEISLSSKDRMDLMQELNIKKTTLSNTLKELTDKKLIAGGKGSYTINPKIFWKGDLLSRNKILEVKEIQIAFSLNLDDLNIKEKE